MQIAPDSTERSALWARRRARRAHRRRKNLATAFAAGLAALLGSVFLFVHEVALSPARAQEADDPLTAATRTVAGMDLQVDGFNIHVPEGAALPAHVVIVLHGMGSSGLDFSAPARDRADNLGWVLVAPTFNYGNWMDPAVVTGEAETQLPRIAAFIDQLPWLLHFDVSPKVSLYGFSRGAQTANRFALAYPERVARVAIASAGDYTVPATTMDGQHPLDFPYGVANLDALFRHTFDRADFLTIPFWIGVGEADRDPGDVPHQWDSTIGTNRVERAQRFALWLQGAGMQVTLQMFPGTGHTETAAMREAAYDALAAGY